ncbi:hypothetical protein HBA54_09285 [Pelagibius litoralis]|uniref:Uncharacterized protein n=1 Tax=Pelagibius litoralis TaxID=374515 RepID=A0A967C316_9PROT|nr:hypothetical protein [Pelagibius litoralis]NIA68783.1 hypothetical protein [Pelagibius litoralis]
MADLEGYIERVDCLDKTTRADMFKLYEHYYGGTSEELFLRDLADKQYAVILRDPNHSLQGFSSIKVWEESFRGDPVRIMYSGDTIVHQDHWGQQALAFTWIHFSGALKSEAPEVPLYWLLLVKGHRTYRYLRAFYRVFYPAYNRSTPEASKALMDQLATNKFGEFYNSETGVLHYPSSHGHLRTDWAQIPEKDRRRPDVRFFLERNPGYVHGDELICLTELSHKNQNPLAARLFASGYDGGLEAAISHSSK